MNLSVRHITKSLGNKIILDDVSLEVSNGQVLVIIGPSGAGKSTLLKCINILHLIDSGAIYADSKPVICADPLVRHRFGLRDLINKVLFDGDGAGTKCAKRELFVRPEYFRRAVGMVFQEFNLWDDRTILANLCQAPVHVLGISKSEAAERASQMLDRFGMASLMHRRPRQLSGGQRQRVAIIRTLMMQPRLLLLDEITSSLDLESTAEVLDMLRGLVQSGLTTVLVSHHLSFARDVGTRIAVLDKGRIVESGEVAQVLEQPMEERTRKYLRLIRETR